MPSSLFFGRRRARSRAPERPSWWHVLSCCPVLSWGLVLASAADGGSEGSSRGLSEPGDLSRPSRDSACERRGANRVPRRATERRRVRGVLARRLPGRARSSRVVAPETDVRASRPRVFLCRARVGPPSRGRRCGYWEMGSDLWSDPLSWSLMASRPWSFPSRRLPAVVFFRARVRCAPARSPSWRGPGPLPRRAASRPRACS